MGTEYRKRLFSGRLPLLSAVVLLSLCGFGPGLPSAAAQQIDPSDLWYTAFVRMKEGEAKEREQKALAAYNKFVEAKRLFDAVARDHPDFHPSIVRYRRKELGDKILDLKTFFKNGGAASGAMPQQEVAGVTTGEVSNSAGSTSASRSVPKPHQNSSNNQLQNPASPQGGQNKGLPSWDPEFANTVPSGSGATRPNATARPQQLPGSSSVQPPSGASPFTDATRQIKQQFEQMEKKLQQVELQNKSLNQAVSEREARLRELQRQMTEAQKRERDLRLRFELLEKENKKKNSADKNAVAQVVLLKQQLSEALDALEKVNKQNREMLSELENARAQLLAINSERDKLAKDRDKLLRERDELEKERNQLAEIIENSGDGSKAVARLTKINAKLRADLTEARAYAETLAKVNGDKQVEVEMLKEKVAEIAEGRMELIKENALHESYIAELEGRLKQTAKGVVEMDMGSSAASAEALEENRLLRGVVLRQLRRQAQIKKARQMILEQLDELGVESEDLLASLDVISVTPGLTEEEKKLFKQPQVAELIQGSGGASLQGVILVEGNKRKGSSEERVVSLQDLQEELEQLQKVGQFDFSQGRYKEAARAYRKFLSYEPENVEGICNLATVQMQLKDYDEAEKLLKKSLSLKKGNGRAYYLLGVVYFEQGNLDDALKRFDEGLKIDPKNAKALNCVGVISSKKGWVERAEKSFTKAVAIAPDYADAHFNLSILYTSGKTPNRKKGEKHYRRAVELGLPRDAKIEQVLNS